MKSNYGKRDTMKRKLIMGLSALLVVSLITTGCGKKIEQATLEKIKKYMHEQKI